MAKLRSIVISGNGVNCEMEMAHANRLAGVDAVEIVSIYELLAGEVRLEDYQLINFPGGFLDGDDMGSAKAAATRYRFARVKGDGERLSDQIRGFIEAGKCAIGVCNGFQLLVKLGLLPALSGRYFEQSATLTHNDSGRFEDRWVRLAVDKKSPCVFTRGIDRLELPVRHGEGKYMAVSPEVFREMEAEHLIPLRYADASFLPTEKYPDNPNGSPGGVAGVCDPSGRVFGMMPHPEAYLHRTNHPRWTREDLPENGIGLAFFKNAADFLRAS